MLLDILQQDNYNSFNIKLAHTIGLRSAIYCNELLNILGKVTKKNKFDDKGFFKLDRKYMFTKTTLSLEDQYNIDAALSKINLITKSKDDPNLIKLDIDILGKLITSDDLLLNNDLADRTKLKNSKESKESKKQQIIKALKNNIICQDFELATALGNWIDAIYENGKVLSKAAVKIFQETLNDYTKGDTELAKRLVQIATVQAYRECKWAINIYERDLKFKSNQQKTTAGIMITDSKVAKKEELSAIGY